ncbi:MAG: cell division protein FtsB [Proteobacteria bacterium]|nr:cell division protein FtsB [Pseudomonadota bacterium]
MRWLTVILVLVLIATQYPLWFGRGGMLHVYALKKQIAQQRSLNVQLEHRNEALAAEVVDLKTGYSAIEERARYELGMIKGNEQYIQIIGDPINAPPEDVAAVVANSLKTDRPVQ